MIYIPIVFCPLTEEKRKGRERSRRANEEEINEDEKEAEAESGKSILVAKALGGQQYPDLCFHTGEFSHSPSPKMRFGP